jgi:N-acetyl-anhydromuramyl-L-alanine amidase AmpD
VLLGSILSFAPAGLEALPQEPLDGADDAPLEAGWDDEDLGDDGGLMEPDWADDFEDEEGLLEPDWADDAADDEWLDFEPERIEVEACDRPEPREVRAAHRSCSGDREAPCAVWDPPLSSLCDARRGRLPGVEVHYDYFGAVDCRSSARREEVSMIVIHNGDHARGNDHNWKCRKSAAHYTIDRDGSIYQHIGEERAAWHAGSVNHRSIGIELQIQRGYGSSCNSLTGRALARAAEREGRSEGDIVRELCAPTLSQYLALESLVEDVRSRHLVSDRDVVGHCEVVRPGGHADPRAFDWAYLGLSNEDKLAAVEAGETGCSWYHLAVDDGAIGWEGVLE